MPAKAPSPPSERHGQAEARLFTPPARRLTRKTTLGYECADFAAHVIGEPLLPWQDWLVKHALELNPDGSFRFRVILVLVARQNGKTFALKAVSLWKLYMGMTKLVLGAAQSLDIAREAWQASIDTARTVPDLATEVESIRHANGEQCLTLTSGARYRITAATRSAGRGLSVGHLNLDELREHRTWQAWGALSKTTLAQPDGQIWAFSNAGDDESVVLNQLRESALSGRDTSIFLAEWSAPDGCDLDNWDAIAQANPGLGHTVSAAAIASAQSTDPPAVYRTEVLCQRVENLDEAINLGAWSDGADPAGNLEGLRDRVTACIDVAPDGEHVTLTAAAQHDDNRVRGEVVQAWKSTRDARAQLAALLDQIQPRITAWFPSGPAAALAPILRPRPDSLELKGQAVNDACMGLADLVAARRIIHPDDPLLNAHAAGAQRYYTGDGWRFARRGAGHVDAMYSLAGAVHAAVTVPIVQKVKPLIVAGRRTAG